MVARRTIAGIIILVLAACGELVPVESGPPNLADPGGPRGDAGLPDAPGVPVEAGPDIPPLDCDPAKPFGDIKPLVAVTGKDTTVGSGTAARDALTLLFHTNADDTDDNTLFRIWIGQRFPGAAFVPLRQQRSVSPLPRAGGNDPFLASDGSFFWATKEKKNDRFRIEHATLDNNYDVVTSRPLALDAGGDDVAQPHVVGTTLYFARGDAGAPRYRIWQATLGANDAVVNPRELAELRTGNNEIVWKPVVSKDELTMFYATGREYDETTIVVARRERVIDAWGFPAPLTELGTGGLPEAPTWLSPDGCQLWFESHRGGTQQLYVATRPK